MGSEISANVFLFFCSPHTVYLHETKPTQTLLANTTQTTNRNQNTSDIKVLSLAYRFCICRYLFIEFIIIYCGCAMPFSCFGGAVLLC